MVTTEGEMCCSVGRLYGQISRADKAISAAAHFAFREPERTQRSHGKALGKCRLVKAQHSPMAWHEGVRGGLLTSARHLWYNFGRLKVFGNSEAVADKFSDALCQSTFNQSVTASGLLWNLCPPPTDGFHGGCWSNHSRADGASLAGRTRREQNGIAYLEGEVSSRLAAVV